MTADIIHLNVQVSSNSVDRNHFFFNGKGFESISRRDLNKVYERYAKDPIGFITSTAPNVKLTVKDEQGNTLKNFELPYNPIELSEK